MSAKINYLQNEVSKITSQLAADRGKSDILKLTNKAKGLLAARTELGEEPVREKVQALVNQVHAAVSAYNAAAPVAIDSVANIMSGYDAAVDEE